MKNTFWLLLFATLFLGACGDDDDNGGSGSGDIFTTAGIVLNYDDNNFSAPQLPEGQYEMAVRFPASQMEQYEGQFLRDVAVYLTNVPAATQFYIYGQGSSPFESGDILFNRDVSASVNTDSWNELTLSSPIEITGEDIWISVMVDHPQNIGSVGCDQGPAINNGDNIYEYGSDEWTTLRQFTGNLSDINWNIRANIR